MARTQTGARVPFRHSLRTRFTLSYVIIITVVLVLMNTYPMLAMQSLIFRNKEVTLKSQISIITTNLAKLETLNSEGVAQVMTALQSDSVGRMLVTDESGLILYDTETYAAETETDADGESADAAGSDRYALFQEVVQALDGQVVFQSSYRDGAFRSGAASPVVYRNVVIGAVYLYEYDAEQADMLARLQDNLWKLSVLFFVLALVFSSFLARQVTGGISRLLNAVSELREGGYHFRAEVRGQDELSQLTGEFNALARRLEETDTVRRRFVSDASHELRTPLASIKLLADSILQSGDNIDMDTTREFVADIGQEAERLNRITEALLVLTRLDSGQEVPSALLDLRDSVTNAARLLRPVAKERDVTILLELGDEPCPVRANADDLYQILFNLMENAVKYNFHGGSVTVTTAAESRSVTVAVSDTGIGIPEEDRERIFDRFFRVDKARSRAAGGTGLGLSIVQDTTARWGGKITVEAVEPHGTCFRVSFPRGKEDLP